MNALAHALAHGGPDACLAVTVHAKTREGNTPHHTAPQEKFFGVETSIHASGSVTRRDTRHGWMGVKP